MSWFFKKDLRYSSQKDEGWVAYKTAESKKIENAFQKKQKKMKLSETYSINFDKMIQYRNDDPERQRLVKRDDPDNGNNTDKDNDDVEEEEVKKKSEKKKKPAATKKKAVTKKAATKKKDVSDASDKDDASDASDAPPKKATKKATSSNDSSSSNSNDVSGGKKRKDNDNDSNDNSTEHKNGNNKRARKDGNDNDSNGNDNNDDDTIGKWIPTPSSRSSVHVATTSASLSPSSLFVITSCFDEGVDKHSMMMIRAASRIDILKDMIANPDRYANVLQYAAQLWDNLKKGTITASELLEAILASHVDGDSDAQVAITEFAENEIVSL